MTVDEYRQRMIQTFHNADCNRLVPMCVLPNERGFEYLEWLLKNHYEKDPCEDYISRNEIMDLLQLVIEQGVSDIDGKHNISAETVLAVVKELPSVILKQKIESIPKTGHWVRVTDKAGHLVWECNKCGWQEIFHSNYCPDCGAKMVELQEGE